MTQRTRFLDRAVRLFLVSVTSVFAAQPPTGIKPSGSDGKPLNLDFEEGTLNHWKAEGRAFEKQPIQDDTVVRRRSDMKSDHTGSYWVGTYEIGGDDLTGTLTSVAFKISQPFASFLVAGGSTELNRVELVRADTGQAFFKISGFDTENLRPVVVDLQPHLGKEIFIRVIDHQIGGWGHINFDDFKFHAAKPVFANVIDPAQIAKQAEMPSMDSVKFAGLTPEDAAKAITLPPNFSAKLFAAEPNVQQPIAFAIDDRGRLWVAEGFTYPRRAPEGQGKDRILILEDTDGDHKFDKRTVFMEKLNLISGLEVGFGGVWIGAAPHLLFIPDKDRDDKPDSEPQILLDGWDFRADTHETLNTFTWGPDGWLYGCHGVFCPSNVGKPGAPESERQWVDAAVWRYHPLKHRFEVFAEGTSNPWGVDFDEYGQCFIEACVIPHLWHMIQGARYERQGGLHYSISLDEIRRNESHRDPRSKKPVYPHYYADIKTIGDHVHYAGNKGPHAANDRSDSAGGGHAHAGMMVYLGDSWPSEYRGKLFMNNIHGQRLNMDAPERRGSGYVGKHGADFLNFNDRWSQALNMLYDQDGSVYIIDWYDKNQCHHNNVDGHDRSNGRIFKVVYGQAKFTPVDLQKRTDEELVQLQLHKNDWYVRHARRILQERGSNTKVHESLTRMLSQNLDVTRKLRALWALHVTGGLTEQIALEQLRDTSEYIRAWAIQFLAEDRNASEAARLEFARFAKRDPSPFVRLYLAAALQRMPVEQRPPILEGLLAHAEDAQDHNLPLMYWYATEPVAAQSPPLGITLMTKSKIPLVRQFIARRMASVDQVAAAAK
ncbi:MAG: dehydrogenase [Verrucomicrobia bacterium]|nr:dehydrogenase [Verrucomicrobiota bacterium]